MMSLSLGELALARYYSYRLVGRLFEEGLVTELLPTVAQIPELAQWLPAGANPDLLAADFQHLFGFSLFPYESLFVGESGLLGGEVAARVSEHYARSGRDKSTTADPDHLSMELDFLAFLCQQEWLAWQAEQPGRAKHWQHQQWQFLHQHLLNWLGALVIAISQQRFPFFTALAHQVLELSHHHYQELSADRVALPMAQIARPTLTLEYEKTTLNDIARYLLTPCHSGLFLSRDNIGQMGQWLGVPAGFGSRQQMLVDLFQTAGNYNHLPNLLMALQEQTQTWQTAFTQWQNRLPALTPFHQSWQQHLIQTQQLLTQISLSTSELL